METDTEIVKSYLKELGFSTEFTDIYIALCVHGTQTISQLSRHSGVERTRIYRMLDELKKSKLVVVEVRYKREMLSAAPPSTLHLLVDQKERAVSSLKASLPTIHSLLTAYQQQQLPTRVQVYKGDDGIKQMIWNETKAKGEVRCILYGNVQRRFGINYFSSWVHECNKRNVRFKGIIGDHFTSDQKHWYTHHQNERLKHWTERSIDSAIFPITYSTVIFDNVVNYYNWKNDHEVFGIEIYSQEIADAQEKLFELLWEKAAPSQHVLDR